MHSGSTYLPRGNLSHITEPNTIYDGVHSGTIDLVAITMLVTQKRITFSRFGTPFFQEPMFAFVCKSGWQMAYKLTDAVFLPFSSFVWLMLLITFVMLIIIEEVMEMRSDFWKLFLASAAGLLCIHYSANLRAMTSASTCPDLPFKDVTSLANAIQNRGFKLVIRLNEIRRKLLTRLNEIVD